MGVTSEEVDALRAAFEQIQLNKHNLQAGDIVMIHPATPGGFKFPKEGRPAIIGEFLTRPITPNMQAEVGDWTCGSPYSAMTFDCIVHVLEPNDGDMLPFLMDSRRLVKVES